MICFRIPTPRGAAAAAGAITLAALSGCAGPGSEGFGPISPQALEDSLRAADAEAVDGAGGPAAAPEGPLSLRSALAAALLNHPRLKEAAWGPRIAEALRLQASRRPNPELEVSVEGFGGDGSLSGFDNAETTVVLSQVLELGGKRQRRIAAAAAAGEVAVAAEEAVRLEVLTETTLRFLLVLETQRRRDLADRAAALAEEAQRTVTRRVEAGDVAPVDAIRSGLEFESAVILADRFRRELQTRRLVLAAALGQDRPSFGELVGDFGPVGEVPPLASLTPLLEQHPRVRLAEADTDRLRAVAEVERSLRVPDVRLGVGGQYQGEADEPAFVAGVAVPLPLFDLNRGNRLAARLEAAQATDAAAVTRRELAAQLADAHGSLEVASHEAMAVRDRLLPAAEEAFAATRRAYEEGKVAYVAVLEAQQTLFEIESRQLDALAEYHLTLAELEGLIAAPLADRTDPNPDADRDAAPAPATAPAAPAIP